MTSSARVSPMVTLFPGACTADADTRLGDRQAL
jgi:hypothetical protein